MRRLLTALIVIVLAVVLVSPLVDADDAITGERHHQAQASAILAQVIINIPTPIASFSVDCAISAASQQPVASMRC